MNTSKLIATSAYLLLGWAPLCAQTDSVVLFRGAPGGFGVLESRDLGSAAPPSHPLGTAPIRLLALEVTGRTELARLAPDQAWRHDDVPGASRISLPQARGSLYHHEVDLGAGVRAFGYFMVDAAGQVQLLLQLPGVGAAGDQDPLLGRLAIARDSSAFLCATRAAAGGNLLEVSLLTGAVIDRTPAQPPLDWKQQSLFLAPNWGLAVHTDGAQRFQRTPGSSSVEIDFGTAAPTWFSGEVALASSGDFAATVAGLSPLSCDVYVISTLGSVARATPTSARVSRAGYLPEDLDGPYLAVSNDGGLCAWRTERNTREAFLARVPWASAATATQLTSDNNFIDTIDEVGQFAFRSNTVLGFTAGERAAIAGGIDKIDVFSASLPAAAVQPLLQNLSLSSGIATPPFLAPGAIQPEGALELPGNLGRLFLDGDREALVLLSAQGGVPTAILSQVKAFDDAVRSGDQWLLALRRTTSNQPRQVVRWSPLAPLTTQVLFSSANTDEVARLTLRGTIGAFIDSQITGDHLQAVDLQSGGLHLFSPRNFQFGSSLSIASSGELVTALGNSAQTVVFARWVPGIQPKRLGPAVGPGFALRGL